MSTELPEGDYGRQNPLTVSPANPHVAILSKSVGPGPRDRQFPDRAVCAIRAHQNGRTH